MNRDNEEDPPTEESESDRSSRLEEDLHVHQLELEMQNEELRRVQFELDQSRQHFSDLYHQAPVGYVTMNRAGLVIQANDTFCQMLGIGPGLDAKAVFRQFIHPDDRGIFDSRFRAFMKSPANKHIDLKLLRGSEAFPARLQARRVEGAPWKRAERDGSPSDALLLMIVSDITELKRIEDRTRHLALHDGLTQLPNRRYLLEQIARSLASNRRQGTYSALLFLDLDNFKAINDSLGHAVGDVLLQRIAKRIEEHVRQGDTIARMGGDEFVVLLSDQMHDQETLAQHGRVVADKILASVQEPVELERRQLFTTASVGITLFPTTEAEHADDILRQADTAMYRAKATGRNRSVFFERSMQHTAERELSMANDLRVAGDREQLSVLYQPLVNRDGQIMSVEALLRWQHPLLGPINPDEFIPLAEQCGLIGMIGEWVIERVLRDFALLKAAGIDPERIRFGINVSSRQLEHGGFSGYIERLLASEKVSPQQIIFEITENLLIPVGGETQRELDRLVRLGLKLSLDDFGTGFSSLAVVHHSPISQLKIDRSFIADLDTRADAAALVESIILLGHRLGLTVVGEGVETARQAEFLSRNGCDLMQGFYYSTPLTLQELIQFLLTTGELPPV